MGIWGHRLFEDDCALDVRAEFRDHIGDGLSPSRAVAAMVKTWSPEPWDEVEYASFWLALASTAWDLGRLTPLVKRRALSVLDREIGLEGWKKAGAARFAARRREYASIRRRLASPQPAPKVVPRRVRMTAPWKPGTLFAYRCLSGRTIYCRVLSLHKDRGGTYLVVDICRWKKKSPPTVGEAKALPRQRPCPRGTSAFDRAMAKMHGHGEMLLYGKGPACPPMDRVEVLATGLRFAKPPQPAGGAVAFGGWKRLDEYLRTDFGIT